MAEKDTLGRAGEDRAAAHLVERGYRILDRNWRCRDGEIDIVAEHREWVVVVEVKTRRGEGFGHPFDAITAQKLTRLHRLAMAWAVAHPAHGACRPLRVDAISVLGPDPATAIIDHIAGLR